MPEESLSTIREIDANGFLGDRNLDRDADGLLDTGGDVFGILQFSVDIPVGGSTSFTIDYIGGSLSNAAVPLGPVAGPQLQAGDADQDLDFDQLDLVQVQIAAKYLTEQPATWGDGDWSGAPGGAVGNPPAGDGVFNQLDIVAAQQAAKYLAGPYAATGRNGQEGDPQASLVYNVATGGVSVDALAATSLTSMDIDSVPAIFFGDPAKNLAGSFDNDADSSIFKTTFGGSSRPLSLGSIALPGQSEDLVVGNVTAAAVSSLAGGDAMANVSRFYVPVPEPSAARANEATSGAPVSAAPHNPGL